MSGLRLTGGELSGRKLSWVEVQGTHPMGERQRLAIFNMLGDIRGARVLDLFAGSGALGIEALSREAEQCVFVERSKRCAGQIANNLEQLALSERAIVITRSAERVLSDFGLMRASNTAMRTAEADEKFDLIFCDPPYEMVKNETLRMIPDALAPNGRLVLSHPSDFVPAQLEGLELIKERSYAGAMVKIYRSTN